MSVQPTSAKRTALQLAGSAAKAAPPAAAVKTSDMAIVLKLGIFFSHSGSLAVPEARGVMSCFKPNIILISFQPATRSLRRRGLADPRHIARRQWKRQPFAGTFHTTDNKP